LIVLAAVEEDGIIEDLIMVDKVLKAAVSDDYHDNVNKAGFTDWFKSLVEYTKSKPHKYIIVLILSFEGNINQISSTYAGVMLLTTLLVLLLSRVSRNQKFLTG